MDSASDVMSTSSSLRDLGDMEEDEEQSTMREINIMLGFLSAKHN